MIKYTLQYETFPQNETAIPGISDIHEVFGLIELRVAIGADCYVYVEDNGKVTGVGHYYHETDADNKTWIDPSSEQGSAVGLWQKINEDILEEAKA